MAIRTSAPLLVVPTTFSPQIVPDAVRFLPCPHCNSSLVRCVETEKMEFDRLWLDCAECNEEIHQEDAFSLAFRELVERQSYLAAKKGEMPSVTTCPECDRVSWSRWDRECIFCNEGMQTCGLCGTECDPEDFNTLDRYCSSCSHSMQKAMKDD